jgi:Ni,Fe-hydrogenase III small subunit/ferredoxin
MLNVLKVRWSQGRQYVEDLRRATPQGFRGLPVLAAGDCPAGCRACLEVCLPEAIQLDPLRLDLGRCTLCADCAAACPEGRIAFSGEHRLCSDRRDGLVIFAAEPGPPAVAVAGALAGIFGRSLKLRQVSAGGCNACELELNALGNVNFDLGRYGIEFVASPRHADALVLTGPLTRNMAAAVALAWEAMPAPRFVIATGACAISGGPYAASEVLDRSFLDRFGPSLFVPGCPPHPLTFINGILDLLGVDLPKAPPPPRWTPPQRLPGRPGFPEATIEVRRDAAERLIRAVGVDLGLGPDHRTAEERREALVGLPGAGPSGR